MSPQDNGFIKTEVLKEHITLVPLNVYSSESDSDMSEGMNEGESGKIGCGVWGVGAGVWGLRSGVWGVGCVVCGVGSGIWGLGSEV